MYRTVQDFLDDWKYESEATLKIMNSLTDASLGFLAWHIVLTLGEMGSKAGLTVRCPAEETPQPTKANEIAGTYEPAARSVAEEVRTKWTDGSLLDEVDMYGETWKRGYALRSLLAHQTHHRAQMTVLMRQAGLKVPGVYGPSREEWAQFGMPAPQ
jgi:uncharacterized damage-inducible protein DinB